MKKVVLIVLPLLFFGCESNLLDSSESNPLRPSTTLDISLAEAGIVSIVAYNVMGQMVGTLYEGNMNAGSHTITWDASNLASGVYIIKAEILDTVVTQKVVLIK